MSKITSVLTVGEKRNAPYIYISRKALAARLFPRGQKIRMAIGRDRIVITPDDAGDRTVSGKKTTPVIDLNTRQIADVFTPTERVMVTLADGRITIRKTGANRVQTRLQDGSAGSMFSGGGLLDQAAVEAGYTTKWGIEWSEDYADVWTANHDGHMVNVDICDAARMGLPQVELLTGGIPCQPFSANRRQAGNAKRSDTSDWTDHELADMTLFAAMIINNVNPRTIILEEVEPFVRSDAFAMLKRALERMQYHVSHRVISGNDYGMLQNRKRVVIIATTDDVPVWPEPISIQQTFADILHEPTDERCNWRFPDTDADPKAGWIYDHADKQNAKGNGWNVVQLTTESTSVQALTKRYLAGQGGMPVVVHPDHIGEDRAPWRWLTVDEFKMVMGAPADYHVGDTQTVQGEVLGQSVLVEPFRQLIAAN